MADTWFVAKEWKARLVEFAGRRMLRNVANGETTTYDVSRSEGQVSQEGDAFNTKNMNDLEQRVANGFADAKTAVDTLSRDFHDLNYRDLGNTFTGGMDLKTAINYICDHKVPVNSNARGRFQINNNYWYDFDIIRSADDYYSGFISGHTVSEAYQFYRMRGADPVLKKLGRSGTIAGAGAYWKDPPAGQYREWATGCVRWDGDNLVVTVEDDYEQGHLKVGAVVGKKGDTPNWGDKAGGLLVLKY